jgi:hypothetical protein
LRAELGRGEPFVIAGRGWVLEVGQILRKRLLLVDGAAKNQQNAACLAGSRRWPAIESRLGKGMKVTLESHKMTLVDRRGDKTGAPGSRPRLG